MKCVARMLPLTLVASVKKVIYLPLRPRAEVAWVQEVTWGDWKGLPLNGRAVGEGDVV
jgi:hypothetical protein